MTLRTGRLQVKAHSHEKPATRGFTLIELILVMALLVIVLGYAAPSLSRFFKARNLDHEVRRFIALSQYGQNRAVSEGVPMILWINAARKTYGLKAHPQYIDEDPLALEHTLDPDLEIEVQVSQSKIQTNFWTMAPQIRNGESVICFLPEGYLSETSPERILIRQPKENQMVCITASESRVRYEVRTNQTEQSWLRR